MALRDRRTLTLLLDIDANTAGAAKAALALDKVAESTNHLPVANDRATRSFDGLTKSVQQTSRTSGGLNAEIERLTRHIRDVQREASRTGNFELLDDKTFRAQQRRLTQLIRTRKQLFDIDIGDARRAGTLAGAAMSRGVSDSIGALPSMLKGTAIVAVAGLGAVLAPLVGAAIAGAVTGGVGLGGIAGGIALAAKDEGVRSAAADLGDVVMRQLVSDAQVFVEPVKGAIAQIKEAVRDVDPDLRAMFDALAPLVDNLAAGVGGLVRELAPRLAETFENAEPALAVLADELPRLGMAVGEFFTRISASEGAAKGLKATLQILDAVVLETANVINALSDTFDVMLTVTSQTTGVLKDFTRWAEVATSSVPGLRVALGALANAFEAVNDIAVSWDDTTIALARSVNGMAASIGEAHEPTWRLGRAMFSVTTALGETSSALNVLTDGIDNLINTEMAVDDSTLRWKQSIADLADELRSGKRSLDLNSQAGRDNAQAIYNAIGAAAKLRSDMLTKTPSAVAAANKAYQDNINKIYQIGRQAGFTRRQLDNLVGKYRIDISVALHSIGAAFSGLRNFGFAEGGFPPMTGQSFTVGEEGPELMGMQGGRLRVFSAPQTRRVLTPTAGGTAVGGAMTLTIDARGGGGPVDQAMATLIAYLVRTDKLRLTVASNGTRVMAG